MPPDTTRDLVGNRPCVMSIAEAAGELDAYLAAMQDIAPRRPPLTPGSFDPRLLWTAEQSVRGDALQPPTLAVARHVLGLLPESETAQLRWVLSHWRALLLSYDPQHGESPFPVAPSVLAHPVWSSRLLGHLWGKAVLALPMQLSCEGRWFPSSPPG